MGRRLILDTGVLIAAERRGSAVVGVEADDDCVIAAISVAELQTGVELATESRREARAEFVAAILERVPVEPYVATTATVHGRLLAHVHRSGVRREAHDLIVAATAAATNRTVLTTNRAACFEDLPGVACILG